METDRNIDINFLPLIQSHFNFTAFRKPRTLAEKRLQQNHIAAWLPNSRNEKDSFWVTFEETQSFEKFECNSSYDWKLTKKYLLFSLTENSRNITSIKSKSFRRFISYVLREHAEGQETIWLEPYYLKTHERFGFLIDFEFKKNSSQLFNKRVQVLSLSLDSHYRSNKDFYTDKFRRVFFFINQILPQINPLTTNIDTPIEISKKLFSVSSLRLKTKEYIFQKKGVSKSQFMGLKEFGPLSPIKEKVSYFFMSRPQDTDFANQLYRALKGETFESTFKGMGSVFKVEKGIIKGKTIELNKDSFQEAITEIKKMDGKVIPILLLPNDTDKKNQEVYYLAKYLFATEKMPLQVVTTELLSSVENLKWSIANIGLQIFAKLGGQPWKVNPENNECLIIGIGQAHKEIERDGYSEIEKYYAYSVLTDSSGLYLDLEVLGDSTNEKHYINSLKNRLSEIIKNNKGKFKKFVVHTSFKISKGEHQAILETIKQLSENAEDINFRVIKVNTENKFFGYDPKIHSLVPFESTYIQISNYEYLVWFEGLQFHNPNVLKRYPGPTHIEFLFSSDTKSKDVNYLQDVINLSGANWRGFNAKALPVSIHYCRLVAKFIQNFELYGFTDYKIDNLQPWFL